MKINKELLKGDILIFLTACLWSLAGVFSKIANMNPVLLNGLRSLFAVLVTLIYTKFHVKINKTIIACGVCMCLTNVTFLIALSLTTSANAILLQYTMPIFVLIESCIYFKRKPTLVQILVLIIAFTGVFIACSGGITGGGLLGSIIAIGSGLAFSGVFFLNKMKNASPIDSTIIGHGLSALLTLFFIPELLTLNTTSWLAAIGMGTLQMGLAYILFSIGIKYCSSFDASLITMIEVIGMPLLTFIFFNEVPSTVSLIGGGLIIIAVLINILTDVKRVQKTPKKIDKILTKWLSKHIWSDIIKLP